jgi:MSHA biogenesis protein MshQ
MISRRSLARVAALWLAAMASLLAPAARADTPVTLYKSFAGYVNFTGTQVSQRTGRAVCEVHKPGFRLTKTLSGIPSGAKVLAAYLYWAGSGSTADTQVMFESKNFTAQRQYTAAYTLAGTTFYYFGGAADVTSLVQAKGNGTYSFSNLSVATDNPYCAAQGVLGGFSLLVVYEHQATQPFRVLNLYEGFQYTRYSSMTLNVSNFRVPDPLGSATGRLGHITWEGDLRLDQEGEDLAFNGTIMTDELNPPGNQFNSKSNIDGDIKSMGIDFDAYTIGAPILQPGQTTATTKYSSGQDMVLLNAEIVAMPNVATDDLAIGMIRTGQAAPGASLTYTLTVVNNGPLSETGPVTVSDTLPPGMSYVSAGGAGWSCAVSGQVVTCTNPTPLDKGQSLQPVTVTGTISPTSAYTTYTNTATVKGALFDNVSANNTATDTADTSGANAPYAFTVGPCAAGIAIGASGSNCERYSGPFVAGGPAQPLYITSLSGGIPTPLHKSTDRRNMQFSLSCINPAKNTKVAATFASATLKPCTQNGQVPAAGDTLAWTGNVQILFPDGEPSGRMPDGTAPQFAFADVGLVKLNVVDMDSTGKDGGSVIFVSQPARVAFSEIKNIDGGLNPGGGLGFARSGEPFAASIKAFMANNVAAPSFGDEAGPYGPVGLTLGQTSGTPVTATVGARQDDGSWPYTITYNDLGTVELTAMVAGKDNSYAPGTYFGAPVQSDTRTVGRFYPAYFTTKIEGTDLSCLPHMNCPAGALTGVELVNTAGAEYSGQDFQLLVRMYDGAGNEMTGGEAPLITLTPYDKPGPAGSQISVGPTGPVTSFDPSTIAVDSKPPVTVAVTATLPNPFSSSSPRANNWKAPTPIFVRATADVKRVVAVNGTQSTRLDPISSNRGSAGNTDEDGVVYVQGRLHVANAFGSELLRLPLRLTAQYWTGTAWETNTGYGNGAIDAGAMFSSCRKNLIKAGAALPLNCNEEVLKVDSGSIRLEDGNAIMWLKKPGAGRNGSAMVKMANPPPYLPSTQGQAVFGVYKSPFIYIREVY